MFLFIPGSSRKVTIVLQDLHPVGCKQFLSLLNWWAENALALKFANFGFLKFLFWLFFLKYTSFIYLDCLIILSSHLWLFPLLLNLEKLFQSEIKFNLFFAFNSHSRGAYLYGIRGRLRLIFILTQIASLLTHILCEISLHALFIWMLYFYLIGVISFTHSMIQ